MFLLILHRLRILPTCYKSLKRINPWWLECLSSYFLAIPERWNHEVPLPFLLHWSASSLVCLFERHFLIRWVGMLSLSLYLSQSFPVLHIKILPPFNQLLLLVLPIVIHSFYPPCLERNQDETIFLFPSHQLTLMLLLLSVHLYLRKVFLLNLELMLLLDIVGLELHFVYHLAVEFVQGVAIVIILLDLLLDGLVY